MDIDRIANNYKIQTEIECCYTCRSSSLGWKGGIYCEELKEYRDEVDHVGKCDLYRRPKKC